MNEKRLRLLVALGALPMALVACGSATNGTNAGTSGGPGAPPGGTAGGPVVGAGGAGQGTAGAGQGTAGGDIPLQTGPCVQGVPVTTQLPLLQNRQYANVVRDLLGVTAVDTTPVADALVGDFSGAMTAPAWQVYEEVGAKIAAQVMAATDKSKFISCDPAAAGCLKTTIQTFGRKAFRRALTDDEVTAFMSLGTVTPAGTPAEVAEATLNAFLVSPSFLMIPELNTEADASLPNAIKLSQQEVATRLSFLLWGSVPDEELNTAVDGNQLSSKDQILVQAARMIKVREKTGPFVSAFHDNWAQVNNSSAHWFQGKHDTKVYPTYTDALTVANQKELDAFFEEVAYSNGSFQDLLLSNVAFVNKDNASIYGLDPTKYTDLLTKVTLDSATNPRPGFLTRGGFLGSYSDYGSTSPILRGSFMSIWLLSVNPGAPDPAAKMATAPGTFMTQRAYVEALTMQTGSPCRGCHQVFNPLGFVFENYDGIGKWQTTDPKGGAIDASVTTNTINFGDGNSKEISSPVQLMQEIAKLPKAQELYAQAWVSFAYGRTQNQYDQCVVDQMKTKLAGNGYTILSLLADLTQADSFRLRVRGAL
jgi:Protein of unknown function (DUF1592)/Protein of unknown function (DUF1588)/Protein of unknown function (DUF1585)/Protein of unknown function (DUF1595)